MEAVVSSSLDQQEHRSIWQDVREAVAGSQRDFTEGNLDRAILLLSVPMVLEMVMESLFAVVDVFFVARLGEAAVATVGLTEAMLTILFAVALGLSMAATALVARRTGEKDTESAAVAAVQTIWLGIAVSVFFGCIGVAFGPALLGWMGASPEVVATGGNYTRMLFGGCASLILLFLINAAFRGAGDAVTAMRSLWIGNAVNIALNPCLIFGLGPFPELGVTGSAVATTVGRGTGVAYQLFVLLTGRSRLRVERRHWRIEPAVIRRIVGMAASGTFQYLVATASWMLLARMVATFGSAAAAGYTIAIRVIVFAILPSWGLSNAAATLVGQNLGAGKPDRAAKSVWRTGIYNMAFLGLVTVIFLIFAERIIGMFTQEAEVLRVGTEALRVVSYGYIAYAWGMVMVQAFNGAGDTRTPTLINLGCYWCFQLPLAYALSSWPVMGETGIFAAICIAETALAVTGILAFRAGGWKTKQV